jgi:hypothetical protein
MPAGIFANALNEFELALDDLSSSFEFVRRASRLRPRLNGMLAWEFMDSETRKLATSFLEQRLAEESVLFRGMLVSLAGAFEQFVGRILRESVLAISQAAVEYDRLDDRIKKENLYRTGIALRTIHEPPDHLNLDYEALAKNVGTCFAGSKQAQLNAEAFTVSMSIFSPDRLAEALKRVGVKLNWDDLARVREVRDVLEKRDTRETANALQEYLKRFGQTRNKVAHTGSTGVAVMESDLEQHLKFFRTFARTLSSVVEVELRKSFPK